MRKYKPKELDAKRRLLDTNSTLGQKAKAEPNRTEPGTHTGMWTPAAWASDTGGTRGSKAGCDGDGQRQLLEQNKHINLEHKNADYATQKKSLHMSLHVGPWCYTHDK